MREDGTPVLIDFGSARQRASELTAIVSPGYAPFEQYQTQGNQGPWSDLYALGGVLYWLVTGQRPHEAVARIRADTMPSALQTADRNLYRPAFLAAIDWALAPAEEQRPQSVAEWREALLGGSSATSAPLDKTQMLPKASTRAAPTRAAFDPALLKNLESELAQHLGPIANLVVRNAAKNGAHPGRPGPAHRPGYHRRRRQACLRAQVFRRFAAFVPAHDRRQPYRSGDLAGRQPLFARGAGASRGAPGRAHRRGCPGGGQARRRQGARRARALPAARRRDREQGGEEGLHTQGRFHVT